MAYEIDPDIFLATWHEAVKDKDNIWQFAKFLEVLQKRCNEDKKNAGDDVKTLTEAGMKSKMDYYRRSYGIAITKPISTKGGGSGARKERKDKYVKIFKELGMPDYSPPSKKG